MPIHLGHGLTFYALPVPLRVGPIANTLSQLQSRRRRSLQACCGQLDGEFFQQPRIISQEKRETSIQTLLSAIANTHRQYSQAQQLAAIWIFVRVHSLLNLKLQKLQRLAARLSRERRRWHQQAQAGGSPRGQAWTCRLAAAPIIIGSTWGELNSNSVLVAGFWGWFVAQSLKIFTKRYKFGVWDVKAVFDSGGMPSSHSALCMAVTTALGLEFGLQSPLFAVSLCFSLIVMYDAAGVRRHAGKQAEVLNVVLSDLLHGHPASANKLKEVLGHTPLQVICGACLGILVGALFPGPTVVAAI